MNEKLVLTPGGFRHRSLVHCLSSKQGIRVANSRMHTFDIVSDEMSLVPESDLEGTAIPALASGWVAYAGWSNNTGIPISSFSTTWKVPPPPSTVANQIIFLFNGIQNAGSNRGILQPVLQWGVSAAGGGPFWAIASWYVTTDGNAFHTPLIRVNQGDVLIGDMSLAGTSGSQFNYYCEFRGIANTRLFVQNIAELFWCNETLEAYSMNSCSEYPATDHTRFEDISLSTGGTHPTVSWSPTNAIADCGQHVSVADHSSTHGIVDVFYRHP